MPYKTKNKRKCKKNISSSDEDYNSESEEDKISFIKRYNNDELKYYKKLKKSEKDKIKNIEETLTLTTNLNTNIPLRFKFLTMNTTNMNKNILISKYEQLCNMNPFSSEYFKLYSWIMGVSKIPLGIYHKIPVNYKNKRTEISDFLLNIKKELDLNIYGHQDTKEQIIRILSQFISFPSARGYCIGIQGSMGVGKTKLVKNGICNALNIPFSFISLGGISDSSYLKGHSFTYEGSKPGKIVECLIKSKVMNPIFFFDELDKISNTNLGEEITNTLIHITDTTQNEKFNDRYYEELDLDLSKSIMFFTYNDENCINPILKDRMITIKVKGYSLNEKIEIVKNHLLKEILEEYNIDLENIIISEETIKIIINLTDEEEGVRNLKRNINNIISHINMHKYIKNDKIEIKFPFTIDEKICKLYCKKNNNNINNSLMYI
jgi:ATP-dependent Lon protease